VNLPALSVDTLSLRRSLEGLGRSAPVGSEWRHPT
jgi:hypothetical protein